jgi:hypothetical protein
LAQWRNVEIAIFLFAAGIAGVAHGSGVEIIAVTIRVERGDFTQTRVGFVE